VLTIRAAYQQQITLIGSPAANGVFPGGEHHFPGNEVERNVRLDAVFLGKR
jgi:hypothetical protein